MRRLLAVALLAALFAAPAAHADGDPASDYLLAQKVFFPYDLKVPPDSQRQLTALVDEANAKGYTLRVAMIWSSYDLGSITALWRKPRVYARFLGTELRYVYKNRLLIVMPNGFGFNDPRRPSTDGYKTLSKVSIPPGTNGFVEATRNAVVALAAADGVKLSGTVTTHRSSQGRDRLVIVVAALAVLLVAAGLRLALRRRGRQRP